MTLRFTFMFACWLLSASIPLVNSLTYTPSVWMVICSSKGVHWIQVDLNDPVVPEADTCHCLLKQLDTVTALAFTASPPQLAIEVSRVVRDRLTRFILGYTARAPPRTSM